MSKHLRLIGKRSILATNVAKTLCFVFVEASTTAFSKLKELKGTISVFKLEDGAVLVVEKGDMINEPIILTKGCGVVVVLMGGVILT